MYRTRAIHPFSALRTPTEGIEHLWALFVAIGDVWGLTDKPDPYRHRFESFMANRVAMTPAYDNYYRQGAAVIARLVAEHGADEAMRKILRDKPRVSAAGLPSTELEALQRYVADEFVALHMALGGFLTFGARNYLGYFGGANIAGQPAPYRTRDTQ